jgi:hypothetical protein
MAVENPILPGTPDVNVSTGAWIELKSMERWPKMPHTVLRIEHWTPQQRVWHIRRSRVGGETYVLLELVEDKHFLLLAGGTAARILGRTTRPELEASALVVWRTRGEMRTGLLAFLLASHPSLPHVDPHADLGPDIDDPDASLLAGP